MSLRNVFGSLFVSGIVFLAVALFSRVHPAAALAPPDLSQSSLAVTPQAGASGDTLTYTVIISNSGEQAAISTTMTTHIPFHTTYLSGSLMGGATYSPTTRLVSWSGIVSESHATTITYQVVITPPVRTCSAITSTAAISSPGISSPVLLVSKAWSGCQPADLAMHRFDQERSGQTPYAGQPVTSKPHVAMKATWTYPTSGDITASPIISPDKTIIVGSHDGSLYAINPDGSLNWSLPLGKPIRTSPAIAEDGTIYVSAGSNLFAIEPDGSNIRWSYPTTSTIFSSPLIAGHYGIIVVGSADGTLYAIRPDGTSAWTFPTGSDINYSSPAIGKDGTIYIGSDGYLYAITAEGILRWRQPTDNSSNSTPTIGPDGTIYIGSAWSSTFGYLYAFEPDGTPIPGFPFRVDGAISSSPTLSHNGTMIFIGTSGGTYAVHSNGSSIAWSHPTSGTISSSPTLDKDGKLYVGSEEGKTYVLSSTNGLLLASFPNHGEPPLGNVSMSSIAIAPNGTSYVGTNDNNLYAIIENPQPTLAPKTADEESPPGTLVGTFVMKSATTDVFTYTFAPPSYDVGGKFRIEGDELLVNSQINLEDEVTDPDDCPLKYTLNISITGTGGQYLQERFDIGIGAVNEFSPTGITLDRSTFEVDENWSGELGTLSTTDNDICDTHTFVIQNDPCGAFTTNGHRLRLTPSLNYEDLANPGHTCEVTVQVQNTPYADEETFTFDIVDVNDDPVLDPIGKKTVQAGKTLEFTASATDEDREAFASPLHFSLGASAPDGASINPDTGKFTWPTTEAQGPGEYPITIRVHDEYGGEDSETIAVTVMQPGVNIQGPTTGGLHDEICFTAEVVPPNAGIFVYSYFWEADEQSLVTGLNEDRVCYTWSNGGPKNITLTAATSAGIVSDTHTIAIVENVPLDSVAIEGPLVGLVGRPIEFSARVDPTYASPPITYSWYATEQADAIDTTQQTMSYTWHTVGTRTVSVEARNEVSGPVSSPDHTIIITNTPIMVQFGGPAPFEEHENSPSPAHIPVVLTAASLQRVTVDYDVISGSATAGEDFDPTSGTLVFNPDDVVQSIDVPLFDDKNFEGEETVHLRLYNPTGGAELGKPDTGQLVILDDEVPGHPHGCIGFDREEYLVPEGSTATITVTRKWGDEGEITFSYDTFDDTAKEHYDLFDQAEITSVSEGDYTRSSGKHKFGDDEEGDWTFTVETTSDTDIEGGENVLLLLSEVTPEKALCPNHHQARLIIEDQVEENVMPPRGIAYFEETQMDVPEGSPVVTVMLSRLGPLDQPLTVHYDVFAGTASAGDDFIVDSDEITFLTGEQKKQFTVSLVRNLRPTGDRIVNIVIRLSDSQLALSGNTTALSSTLDHGTSAASTEAVEAVVGTQNHLMLTIKEDPHARENIVQFTRPHYFVSEDGQYVLATVERSGPLDQEVTVDYRILDGSASRKKGDFTGGVGESGNLSDNESLVDAGDYTANLEGRLTFKPGDRYKAIEIRPVTDELVEGLETAIIRIEQVSANAILGVHRQAMLYIADDENPYDPARVYVEVIRSNYKEVEVKATVQDLYKNPIADQEIIFGANRDQVVATETTDENGVATATLRFTTNGGTIIDADAGTATNSAKAHIASAYLYLPVILKSSKKTETIELKVYPYAHNTKYTFEGGEEIQIQMATLSLLRGDHVNIGRKKNIRWKTDIGCLANGDRGSGVTDEASKEITVKTSDGQVNVFIYPCECEEVIARTHCEPTPPYLAGLPAAHAPDVPRQPWSFGFQDLMQVLPGASVPAESLQQIPSLPVRGWPTLNVKIIEGQGFTGEGGGSTVVGFATRPLTMAIESYPLIAPAAGEKMRNIVATVKDANGIPVRYERIRFYSENEGLIGLNEDSDTVDPETGQAVVGMECKSVGTSKVRAEWDNRDGETVKAWTGPIQCGAAGEVTIDTIAVESPVQATCSITPLMEVQVRSQNNGLNVYDQLVSFNPSFGEIKPVDEPPTSSYIVGGEQTPAKAYLLNPRLLVGPMKVTVAAGEALQVKTVEFTAENCNDSEGDNNHWENAGSLERDRVCQGSMETDPTEGRKEKDYYTFTLNQDSPFTIYLRDIPEGADYDIKLLNSIGEEIKRSENEGSVEEVITVDSENANTPYYIEVLRHKKSDNHDNTYRLVVIQGANGRCSY